MDEGNQELAEAAGQVANVVASGMSNVLVADRVPADGGISAVTA